MAMASFLRLAFPAVSSSCAPAATSSSCRPPLLVRCFSAQDAGGPSRSPARLAQMQRLLEESESRSSSFTHEAVPKVSLGAVICSFRSYAPLSTCSFCYSFQFCRILTIVFHTNSIEKISNTFSSNPHRLRVVLWVVIMSAECGKMAVNEFTAN